MSACRLERDVMNAATEDTWTDALRRHVTECDDCAAAMQAAPWMHEFASIDEREHILPDPSVVWLKAQLLRGSAAADRAARPLAIYQMAAYVAVAAGWAALLTWKWNALQAWLNGLTPSGFIANASGSSSAATTVSVSFFGAILALASLTVVIGMHTILSEE